MDDMICNRIAIVIMLLIVAINLFKVIVKINNDSNATANHTDTENTNKNVIIPNDDNFNDFTIVPTTIPTITDDVGYFRFLYECSGVGILRVDKLGNLRSYNFAIQQIFSNLIPYYNMPVDDIIKTIIIDKMFNIFNFTNEEFEKNLSTTRVSKFIAFDHNILPSAFKVDVIFEYDMYGKITYYDFFILPIGEPSVLLTNIEHINIIEYETVEQNMQYVKKLNTKTINSNLNYAIFLGMNQSVNA